MRSSQVATLHINEFLAIAEIKSYFTLVLSCKDLLSVLLSIGTNLEEKFSVLLPTKVIAETCCDNILPQSPVPMSVSGCSCFPIVALHSRLLKGKQHD